MPNGNDNVSLRCSTLRRVNFASAQNHVPIIKEIMIENLTGEVLSDIKVTLRSVPPVIEGETWNVDRILPDSQHLINNISTQLNSQLLRRLNEAEIGTLEFRMDAQGLQTIIEKHEIDLLAHDQWGGVNDMAQILAAFVPPNDPAVPPILKNAARLLEQAGYNGSMDGYQSNNPERAYMLANAIWSATTSLGLTYAMPPASFEKEGQKIRTPSRIKDEGLATCLDSTLLLAAAFEAVGLNPVVLLSEDHAWVGVWMVKKDFGNVTEPDVVAIRKAAQAREFLSIETTLLTERPVVKFDRAVDVGRLRLSEKRDPEFTMAIDIARSRAARIRPLANSEEVSATEREMDDETEPALLSPVPDLGFLPGEINEEEVPETPKDRIERWQRKLLDLSLRNRLLNYRDSKQTLPLYCPSVATLEDKLASGKKFKGFSLKDNDPFGDREVSPEEEQHIKEEVISNAFERGQVVVPLSGEDMNNRLLTLYRRAKSDMQEGGTNTLFLAVGFLRWKKSEGDTRSYRAPLILVPVRLERQSVQSPFRIAHHEDDARFNSTLLEFLKRDFALHIPELEGDLPSDESGIDIPFIFNTMQQKVRHVQGFEVVEDLALSTFSFAKYLMWKDLVDRTNQLRENRLVRHLIDGAEEEYRETGDGTPIAPEEIDRRCSLKDLLTPLPADSSQLAAVLAASRGHDFVLVGPPGTGKSQTITNIIAQCLSEGKTVLFVAEKAAALNVVHRRLVMSKLGDAVLELHSNKADRKLVLTQLGRSWDRIADGVEENWVAGANALKRPQDQLNSYVEALHAKGKQGFSVFNSIALVASGEDLPFKISFPHKDTHNEEEYQRLVNCATELGQRYAAVGNGPPLSLIRCEEYSYQWKQQLLEIIDSTRATLNQLRRDEHELAYQLGLYLDPELKPERRKRLKALAARLKQGSLDLSSVPNMPANRIDALMESFASDVKKLEIASSKTEVTYALDVMRDMPLDKLEADWREAQAKIWPISAFAKRKVRKLLESYADKGTADPAGDLRELKKMRQHDNAISQNPLALLANGGINVNHAREAVRQAIEFRGALADLASYVDDSDRFESATSVLTSLSEGALLSTLQAYLATEEKVDEKVDQFVRKGGVCPIGASVMDFDKDLEIVKNEHARLPDWIKWVEKSKEGFALGLGELVKALENGSIKRDAEEAFKKAYATWWLPPTMDASGDLRGFTRSDHENTIATFCNLDDAVAELVPAEVMRRIAHKLPARDNVPRNSELGKLRHQLGLRRPSMPVRQLLKNLPETFGKLAPCVLMSPLSVAQYLPTDQAAFDVVIFDEASQITTWDAIGAIARGRQTIVVGDPKQLPPTNFFGRADSEDEDLPDIERDMPSILDEVSIAGVPHRNLNWHYRSRDEALIAFSNHRYYDDRLVTFPAPSAGFDAIKFHKVNGTYARGAGRTNQEEARTIAETAERLLSAWLADPEDKRQTLGIITFNSEQQTHILDRLDKIRRDNNELEWFFNDERAEPVIVKNLENIQGDERDVMLFSVTFGPDHDGRLTMNFGALNNEGGERRLNVAITRARREFHIFSSIRAEQIDLSRTRALGVKHLKEFLDYAESGSIALATADEGSSGPAESPFEEAVANALETKGWKIRTQIGVSGFRVDLGVVHPDYPGRYLAGIECDGAAYHSSATARDRDKVRQAVLENLGWTILRVWSTEWFQAPSNVVDRLDNELKKILEEDQKGRITST